MHSDDIDGVQKVCCSDFVTSGFHENKEVEDETQTSEDEIENHRNIRLLPTECGDLDGNRIVEGTSAGLYEFPWLALISYSDKNETIKFKCGGSVINARYVLTAAHCIVNKTIAGVRIGDYDISQLEDCVGEDEIRECETKYQDIAVTHKIHHRGYVTRPHILNDIGLLRLARPVDFSYRNSGSICLPITKDLREKDLVGERGVVAGWGMTENQTRSNILLKVELPIFSESLCNTHYKSDAKVGPGSMTGTFCAGETGHDSCKGDSGGPLMLETNYDGTYKYVQYGIVSYGPTQCGFEKPGIYTDVRKFMKWILDTNCSIETKNQKKCI
uniref:Melanization protease 1 n=1 Tax=Papilio xuthus TaxID=66420 RepID=I4DNJ8_PAPXU|nr:serine protease easter-like [Papilio xuthus]BAM19488.1 melanization protease 1 [Papilio xuthus]